MSWLIPRFANRLKTIPLINSRTPFTDPDGDSLTYLVDNLPLGASFDSATQVFSWMPDFTQGGNYPNVMFTVTDNGTPVENNSEAISITVGDVNRQPIAEAGLGQTVHLGAIVMLDGSQSSDPDGDLPLSFEWTFVDKSIGSNAEFSDFTSSQPSFTADVSGEYSIKLIVTDSRLLSSVEDFITISTEKLCAFC